MTESNASTEFSRRPFIHYFKKHPRSFLIGVTALCWVLSVYDAALVGKHTKQLKA